jgi:hypothetical protein
MKQTLTKLIALVGLVSFLAVGCSTTPSGPRPAPTPEEVSAVVSPALTYVVFKVTQKNPELAPYFKIVGSTVREFSETDVIAPMTHSALPWKKQVCWTLTRRTWPW